MRRLSPELAARAHLLERRWPERLARLEAAGIPLAAVLEPNFYGLWGGGQTAKGTPNVAPIHRLLQVGGDFGLASDDGSEEWSDLTKYGGATDWVNSRLGNGTPAYEATPSELAWTLWAFHGAETVVAVTGPPAVQKHTFIPSTGKGKWCTFFRRVGLGVPMRHQFNDCLITQVQIEGSTANKAVRVTPTILSLDPMVPYAADPAQALPTDKTLLYTDGAGSFTIDGTVFTEQSSFSLVINDAWTPIFGDGTTPVDVVQGNPAVAISATIYFTTAAFSEWCKLVYGTAAPAAGTKPLSTIPALGSYAFDLKQRDGTGALNGIEFKLTIPGVKWTIPDAPAPNPAGGATEVTLAGAMRPVAPGATNPYTIDVFTPNAVTAFAA